MDSAAQFIAQFFPLFLLGALFGKLMDDSGCVNAIARTMSERLGPRRSQTARQSKRLAVEATGRNN